jgi:hypothetical protein
MYELILIRIYWKNKFLMNEDIEDIVDSFLQHPIIYSACMPAYV